MKHHVPKSFFYKQRPFLWLFCLLFFAVFSKIQAQQVIVASGNTIAGNGGSASYSVGQIVQSTNSGANGTAFQGIQLYFEDATLTIIDLDTQMDITTYPNPTSSFINIMLQFTPGHPLNYVLYNAVGGVVLSGKIKGSTTNIPVHDLSVASYLLKINNASTTLKIFKIIKN